MTTKEFIKILQSEIAKKNSWGKNELITLIATLVLEHLVISEAPQTK